MWMLTRHLFIMVILMLELGVGYKTVSLTSSINQTVQLNYILLLHFDTSLITVMDVNETVMYNANYTNLYQHVSLFEHAKLALLAF